MSYRLSRSEKKRRAKNIADLSEELVALAKKDINKLPCDDFLKKELIHAQPLKAGARKRQLKYISKQLRTDDVDPLLAFLAEKKGSRLKQSNSFHELERFRDDLIDDALAIQEEAWFNKEQASEDWQSTTLSAVAHRFNNIDLNTLRQAAMSFARTHKKTHSREVFRILKAATEQEEMGKRLKAEG